MTRKTIRTQRQSAPSAVAPVFRWMMALGVLSLAASCLAQSAAPADAAQDYPKKPVRIITAGVGTLHDIITRQIGQQLSKRWGQAIVVDNQAAAGLTIGAGMAARAAPDGYTLLMGDRSALAGAPSLYKDLPYDPAKDFVPITLVARAPQVMIANPAFPAGNLREFIAYAKKHPGEINYAGAGPGTATHVAGEMLKTVASIDLTVVQYKGGGPGVLAVIGGEVQIGFSTTAPIMGHLRAGKLKAFAIGSVKRFAGAPDVPTAAEQGLPGFVAEQWIGMVAPARTPTALITKLNQEFIAVVQSPAMHDALLTQGAEPITGTPAEFSAFIRNETTNFRKLVASAGIKAE